MSAPWKPYWPTTRSSSSAALGGSAVGSVAKPPNRLGWRFMAAATNSLASRASSTASAATHCSTPGELSDNTCISIPAASISTMRSSSTSWSCAAIRARRPPCLAARSMIPLPGPFKNPGVAKCSSRVMVRIFRFRLVDFKRTSAEHLRPGAHFLGQDSVFGKWFERGPQRRLEFRAALSQHGWRGGGHRERTADEAFERDALAIGHRNLFQLLEGRIHKPGIHVDAVAAIRRVLGPGVAEIMECLRPGILRPIDREGATHQHVSAGNDHPLQDGERGFPIQPMQCTADGCDLEDTGLDRQVLEARFDQFYLHAGLAGQSPGRSQHGGFRINARGRTYVRREADGERRGATGDIQQPLHALEAQTAGHFREEFGWIWLAVAIVKPHRRFEAPHQSAWPVTRSWSHSPAPSRANVSFTVMSAMGKGWRRKRRSCCSIRSQAPIAAVKRSAGRIASLYPMHCASSSAISGVLPRHTRLSRQGPLTSLGTAETSSRVSGASTNAISAPTSSAALARRMASAKPSTARASVRAMIRKSGSWRAAVAARILARYGSSGITSLRSRWPHFLGKPWSSRCKPATPARSYSRTVRTTFSSLP